jgi:hypothetical protein
LSGGFCHVVALETMDGIGHHAPDL